MRNKYLIILGIFIMFSIELFQGCASLPKQTVIKAENNLFTMPDTTIKTRWYTHENINGLPGEGGKTRFG